MIYKKIKWIEYLYDNQCNKLFLFALNNNRCSADVCWGGSLNTCKIVFTCMPENRKMLKSINPIFIYSSNEDLKQQIEERIEKYVKLWMFS